MNLSKEGKELVGEGLKEAFLATGAGQTAAMVWDGAGTGVHALAATKALLKGNQALAKQEGAKALEDLVLTVAHDKLRHASVKQRLILTALTDAAEHVVDPKIASMGSPSPAADKFNKLHTMERHFSTTPTDAAEHVVDPKIASTGFPSPAADKSGLADGMATGKHLSGILQLGKPIEEAIQRIAA